MEFGKFRGLESLGSLASLGKLGDKSNNLLIWVLLAVIVFGFGKGKSLIPPNLLQFQNQPQQDHYSRKHGKGTATPPPSPFGGFGTLGQGAFGSMLGGNGIFIVIVIAILFLSKDDKKKGSADTFVNADEAVNED